MPQMVALFNGVGGGAVALISFVQYREALEHTGVNPILEQLVDPVRGDRRLDLVLGLEHRVQEAAGDHPRAPDQLPGPADHQHRSARVVVACARDHRGRLESSCSSSRSWSARAARQSVRAADRRRRHAGGDLAAERLHRPAAAAAGLALDNVALIVGGMLVGASGSILTMLMAEAMNRSIPNIIAGGFGGVTITPGASGDGERFVRSTGAADVAIQLRASKVVVAPGYGMAVAQAQHTVRELADELEKRGVARRLRDPPRRRPHARPHERAARRGRRALRPSQGDGRDQSRVPGPTWRS